MNAEPPEITDLRQRIAARHKFRARVWRAGLAALGLFWVAVVYLLRKVF